MSERTSKATRKCFDWLKWCLDNGWDKSQLDDLQQLWWQYHDKYGEIITGQPAKPLTAKDFHQ